MGQYYKLAIKDGKGQIFCNDRKYVDSDYVGAKLMEHGYLHNWLCHAVAEGLENGSIKRLAWVGDYAEDDEIKEISKGELTAKMIWGSEKDGPENNYGQVADIIFPLVEKFTYTGKFLVNHTKKVYMSFDEYIAAHNAHENAEKGWEISPFTILTAIGNGRGGGDYWGEHQEAVGTWAWDEIGIAKKIPDGYTKVLYPFHEDTKVIYPFREDR